MINPRWSTWERFSISVCNVLEKREIFKKQKLPSQDFYSDKENISLVQDVKTYKEGAKPKKGSTDISEQQHNKVLAKVSGKKQLMSV